MHGTKDTVMGFPFGLNGDITYPVKLWRDANGCDDGVIAGRWSVAPKDIFLCTNWEACKNGGTVRLDVHSRGHFIPVGWFARQLDELLHRKSASWFQVACAAISSWRLRCTAARFVARDATITPMVTAPINRVDRALISGLTPSRTAL